jgi:histidine kinase/DNA gyrase B/HSP90-like ATPase
VLGDRLSVTSHVGRDLLQSAALFKHEHAVAWEYASNGLQYVDPGTAPVVQITIDQASRSMSIIDNGRGMSFSDLANYFTMHGENLDRKKGRPGRGMFGTGKSAAFGIANRLRVTTVRGGLRSKVELDRAAVESPAASSRVPVRVLEESVPTGEPNGTKVDIIDINLKKIDAAAIIREIERHIAHWPNATVFVGHHQCQYVEPPTNSVEVIPTRGGSFEAALPGVELVLKVAKAPLDPERQGIAITSSGVLHETTLAGCERKPFANYLFGNIDVPQLATDTSLIAPFDMARSMKLNPQNVTVQRIHAFIGMNIERVSQELERQDRERRKQESARRLAREASAIAEIINNDFNDWRSQIQKVLAQTPGTSDHKPAIVDEEGDALGGEGDITATIVDQESGGGGGWHPGPGPGPDPDDDKPIYTEDVDGDERVERKKRDPAKRSRSGGFNVDFRNMGADEARAKYERSERLILVNLDHPQIVAALGVGGTEDPAFRRLAYEVAFSEYAIALAVELANENYFLDVIEPIIEIRGTMNRLAAKAAMLYR